MTSKENITVTKEVNPYEALMVIKGISKKGKPYVALTTDNRSPLIWEEEIQQFFIDKGAKFLDLTPATVAADKAA